MIRYLEFLLSLMGQGSSSRYTSGSSGSSDTIILDEPVSPSTDVEFQAKLLKLITMSKSTELPIQRAVAECLANEAMLEERRALIVNLGGLDLLQSLIMSKDPEVQRLVTHTLANLAVSDHNQLEIAKNLDLIQALISLLGSTFPATQRQAAKAIANLAVKSENKHILLKHNALPPLLHLASSGMSNIQTEALAAIANLSVDDDNEVLIGDTLGGVQIIMTVLSESLDDDVLAQGARAIRNLSIAHVNKQLIRKYDGDATLSTLAASKIDKIRCQALITLHNISH